MKEKFVGAMKAAGGFFAGLWKSFKSFCGMIYSNKKAFAGAIILLIFVFLALFGRLIFPYDDTTSFAEMYQKPSGEHWLGTDGMGRDLFDMIIYGTQDVMTIAVLTALITVGGFLGNTYERSKLYDPAFTHGCREASR